MLRPQPAAVDLIALLARADLEAIGLVLVHPHRRDTVTLWCEPSVDPQALIQQAAQAGQVPAALVFVCAEDVSVLLQEGWHGVEWVEAYVDQLARDIQIAGGLQPFIAALDPANVVATRN